MQKCLHVAIFIIHDAPDTAEHVKVSLSPRLAVTRVISGGCAAGRDLWMAIKKSCHCLPLFI